MPNWCSNTYAFYTKDEDKRELQKLHKKLLAILDVKSETKNDFEPGWLGKVASHHGLDWEKIPCRGHIELIDEYDGECSFFKIYTETAWCPTEELWEAVISQYEGVSLVYTAEEPGCEIYVNTDACGTYLVDKYLIEVCGDAPIPKSWFPNKEKPKCLEIREYFSSLENTLDYCSKFTGEEFNGISELKDYFAKTFSERCDVIACVHEFSSE